MRRSPLAEAAYAAMRVVIGILFVCHGAQKVFGAFGKPAASGDPKIFIGGVIELLGGGLVAVGLLTSVAAFLACGEMAVAYFLVHAPKGFWPIQNQGELAVVYCFVFLAIAVLGGGLYSLDGLRQKPPALRAMVSPATLTRARMSLHQDPPL